MAQDLDNISTQIATTVEQISHHYEHFYQNPAFWVGVSFVLVVVLSYKPVAKLIGAMLQSRINNILTMIQNASQLKDDAQKLLSTYEQKQKNVSKEVDELIKSATEQTDFLKKETIKKLDNDLKIKEKELQSKIFSLESTVKQEILNAISDKTIAHIQNYMQKKQDPKTQEKLVDKVIENL